MEVKIQNLTKIFQDKKVLDGISLTIKDGEKVAFIGLSGSGKTTLLRCINGFVEPNTGEVILNDERIDFSNKKATKKARKKIAMVYQLFNLVERTSVLHNVLTGSLGKEKGVVEAITTSLGMFKKSDKKKAMDILEFVKLDDKAHSRVDRLSGGQKQRVAIARGLMQNPKILLADEPTANLDVVTGKKILKLFNKINKAEKITIITVIHHLESITDKYFDRVVALKNGLIIFDGKPHEMNDTIIAEIYGEEHLESDDEEREDND